MKYRSIKINIITHLLLLISVFLSSCSFVSDDSDLYGLEYNSVRKKLGTPLVKKNMLRTPGDVNGNWTIYTVSESFKDYPCHKSKTIRTVVDENVCNEEDIYRNQKDGKIVQLNVESLYDWKNKTLKLWGNVGVLSEGYDKSISLNKATEIDSVLRSWGLSRFDEY